MNTLSELLTPWLADFFLLATLLLTSVLLACWRIKQPARRLALARQSLFALFLLAGLCALPGWSLVHLLTAEANVDESPLPRAVADALQSEQPVPQSFSISELESLPQSLPTHEIPASETIVAEVPVEEPMSTTAWLAGIYLCGCLCVLLWQASGGALARRLIRQATSAPPELQSLLQKITAHARPAPKFLVSQHIQAPAALGLLQPTILLPQQMVDQDENSLLPILAHEWAHIRHGDLRTLAAVRLLAILLWPHPLYLLLRRQLRLDQEALADVTASELTTRADYAQQLVDLARQSITTGMPRLAASVGLWESASQLRRRVAMLLDDKLTILRSCSRRWRIGSAIGLITIAAGLSLVTLAPSEPLLAKNDSSVERVNVDEQSGYSLFVENSLFTRPTPLGQANVVEGICTSPNGQPLAGVRITVYRKVFSEQTISELAQTTSGIDGKFRIENVVDMAKEYPDGIGYGQSFSYPGVTKSILTLIQAKGKATIESYMAQDTFVVRGQKLPVELVTAAKLTGKVVGPNKEPVANAKVSLSSLATTGKSPIKGVRTAHTDSHGNYAITDLPPFDAEAKRRQVEKQQREAQESGVQTATTVTASLYRVQTRHPDFASHSTPLQHIPGSLDIQLKAPAVIEGRVVDLADKPAANVKVRLQTYQGWDAEPQRPAEPGSTYQNLLQRTDAKGRYRFSSLPEGKYSVRAFHPKLVSSRETIIAAANKVTRAPDLTLSEGARVRVQFVDHKSNNPITVPAGSKACLTSQIKDSSFYYGGKIVDCTTTGECEFHVPPGMHFFNAFWAGPKHEPLWHAAPKAADKHTQLSEGDTIEIRIEMNPVK